MQVMRARGPMRERHSASVARPQEGWALRVTKRAQQHGQVQSARPGRGAGLADFTAAW
jgi:hypothetical protein